ncbi:MULTISPECIES: hypothetical protein [unclassified Isoptericola]|uniref:hypothetical protein n=1 Tax=unclassified Isoptericola TaxID=2623355 RepID=UPI002712A771|nr:MULTISPECIES: hypothetical protein [unclassified Isoptericola]MDO8143308.1 hypothetical protein [Isoptericola sp. 178]MDO8147168.1 hypothetical protein [Isoptericola sp. b515]MDO8150516.1 hypothetical protein [Isoptericola sp. b408]
MHDDGPARAHAPRAVEWSLALGIAGLPCALVPVVGDWLAAPLGLAALTLGSIGSHVADRDGHPGVGRGLAGALLGLGVLAAVLFSAVVGAVGPA